MKTRSTRRNAFAKLPLTAAIVLAMSTAAYAQEQPASQDAAPTLDAITVTAQKRVENLQAVPISIQVLGTQQLDELNINDFDDVVKLIPSVSFESNGPGFNQVYMRGVASGGNGNHSASLPSVGVYLDEQPITTIQGTLDLHMYDIARVEALAGPQGTLYGASSQSGTLRLITNKPDPSGFEAGYGLEYNSIDNGGNGHGAGPSAALAVHQRIELQTAHRPGVCDLHGRDHVCRKCVAASGAHHGGHVLFWPAFFCGGVAAGAALHRRNGHAGGVGEFCGLRVFTLAGAGRACAARASLF